MKLRRALKYFTILLLAGIVLLTCMPLVNAKVPYDTPTLYCIDGLTYCSAIDTCVDLLSDVYNCGRCGRVCADEYACQDGVCTSTLTCGNGRLDAGESCDGTLMRYDECRDVNSKYTSGTLGCSDSCTYDVSNCCYIYDKDVLRCGVCGNNVLDTGESCESSNKKECPTIQGYEGVQSCDSSCEWGVCTSNDYCGDNVVTGDEECEQNTVPIPSCNDLDGYAGTQTCNDTCTGWNACEPTEKCGDNKCQSAETEYSCFQDCVSGWNTDDKGFTLNNDGSVSFTGSSGILVSDGIDLLAGRRYVLDADISFGSGSSITISIDPTCISNTTFTQIDCGIGRDIYYQTYRTNSNLPVSFTLANPNSHAINNLYFKNATLRIIFTGGAVILANISLREDTPSIIHYDESPGAVSTSGCCPANYCWDGMVCVNSGLWMDNASYEPIWNNIFDTDWILGHVNASAKYLATGYRCVRNDSGIANWAVSSIKYDWDFVKSGYCARDTDCFVNYSQTYGDNSRGCVPTGTIVNDVYNVGSGNHYCHKGNWTTKSYIIATLLQNLSQNGPYVLHCYDSGSLVYNIVPAFGANILSACVLSKPGRDNIITGVVLEDDTVASNFLDSLIIAYDSQFSEDNAEKKYYGVDNYDCMSPLAGKEQSSNFSECVNSNNLYVYYETNYKFFIISNQRVVGIEQATLWDKIKKFFNDIFGGSKLDTKVYDSINYTTSYDRIYILKDAGINVTAIEEYKYDEILGKPVTVFYIDYKGTADANNLIDEMQVFNTVNRTVKGAMANTGYSNSSGQELIIQTDNRTGIWKYFTAVLRTRDPGGN
jgi:hypothetical protein